MLYYLKIMEWKLNDMISNPSVVRKINNVNQKGYIKKKSNEEMKNGDTYHTEIILDSFE